jgi:hypothetical protein
MKFEFHGLTEPLDGVQTLSSVPLGGNHELLVKLLEKASAPAEGLVFFGVVNSSE